MKKAMLHWFLIIISIKNSNHYQISEFTFSNSFRYVSGTILFNLKYFSRHHINTFQMFSQRMHLRYFQTGDAVF